LLFTSLRGHGAALSARIFLGMNSPAYSCQNNNLVLSILGDPVKGIDKLRVILCRESERPALGVKFDN
jgi:hypothetical protein